jgi:hypothetical protein
MLYPKHVEAQSGRLKEQPARPAHWKRTADPVSTESGVHSANTASFALWRAEGGCCGLMHPGRDPAKLDGSGNIRMDLQSAALRGAVDFLARGARCDHARSLDLISPQPPAAPSPVGSPFWRPSDMQNPCHHGRDRQVRHNVREASLTALSSDTFGLDLHLH